MNSKPDNQQEPTIQLHSLYNPPDLKQIQFRIADQQLFFQRMLERIPLETIKTGPHSNTKPLADLTTRELDDPTIALLYAWACSLDVLTFYQERLANEGFLQTALQRDSLVYLGSLLGYRPTDSLGSEAYLAFTVSDDPTVATVQVKAGTRVLSVPEQDETPQTFETALPFEANAAWNRMTPRLTIPQTPPADAQKLVLAGGSIDLEPGDTLLLVNQGFNEKSIDWRVITLTEVVGDSDNDTTTVTWSNSSARDAVPLAPRIFQFKTQAFLFGYDASPWDELPFEVKRANTPLGMSPQDFTDWPGMEVNPLRFDLDAIYEDILPASFLLASTPNQVALHWIAQNQTVYADRFGMADQVSQIASAWTRIQPIDNRLIPARKGQSLTLLKDNLVLIAGGLDEAGKATASAQIFDLSTRTFSPGGQLNEARAYHSATTLPDGTTVFIGGKGELGQAVKSVEIYDPETHAFTVVSSLEEGRWTHTATALPKGFRFPDEESARFAVMIAGGLNGRKTFNSVCFYDPENARFAAGEPLAQARANHTATLLPTEADQPTRIFIAGGNDGNETLGSFEIYDPEEGPGELQDLQAARTLHTATLLVDAALLVLIGGRGRDGLAVASSELYSDEGAYLGEPANRLVPARYSHSATRLTDGQILIAGGTSDEAILDDTWRFLPAEDPQASQFLSGYPLSWPRTEQTAILTENQVMLTGGMGPASRLPKASAEVLDSVEVLDGNTETFTTSANSLFAAFDATATLLPSGYVLITGGTGHLYNTSGTTLPEAPLFFAELYHPETGTFSFTGEMTTARSGQTATLLNNTTVLIAGGNYAANAVVDSLSGIVETIIENLRSVIEAIQKAIEAFDQIQDKADWLTQTVQQLEAWLKSGMEILQEIYGKGGMETINEPPYIAQAYFDLFLKIPQFSETSQTATLPTIDSESDLIATSKPLTVPQDDPILRQWQVSLWDLGKSTFENVFPQILAGLDDIRGYGSAGKAALEEAIETLEKTIEELQAMVSFGDQTAEVYDPEQASFSPTNEAMQYTRYHHTASLLPDGDVLIAGGAGYPTPDEEDDDPLPLVEPLASAEIYKTGASGFKATATMPQARVFHTATALGNGMVLIVGGLSTGESVLDSCLLYNPDTGSFDGTAPLPSNGQPDTAGRYKHGAVLLPDGKVLIAGGLDGLHQPTADAFLYLPNSGQWVTTGPMATPRYSFGHQLLPKRHPALDLPDTQVLVCGGYGESGRSTPLNSAELYELEAGQFRATGAMPQARAEFSLSLLQTGLVLTPTGNAAPEPPEKPTADCALYHPATTFEFNARRETVIQAATEELFLAPLPDTNPVAGNLIHLDRFYMPTPGERTAFLTGQPLVYRIVSNSQWRLQTVPYGSYLILEVGDLVRQLAKPVPSQTDLDGTIHYQWFLETRDGTRGYLIAPPSAFQVLSYDEQEEEAPPKEPLSEKFLIASMTSQNGLPSQIHMAKRLGNEYYRESTTINANVMNATQGATEADQILGSGDGALPNQRFPLPTESLIFLPGTTGPEPALTVFVEQVIWDRVDTFFGQSAASQVYVLEKTEDQGWQVVFGNGENGARLPTGTDNVVANFRVGEGRFGKVGAQTITQLENPPLGIEAVHNPLPASGGVGEGLKSTLRQAIPRSVANLDRIVSLEDYRTYAENYPGIYKAQATAFSRNGIPVLGLTVSIDARADNDQELLIRDLENAVFNLQGPFREVYIAPFSPAGFVVTAELIVDHGKAIDATLQMAKASLIAVFNFAKDGFGQSISASDVLAVLQNAEGVSGVNLKAFYRSDQPPSLENLVEAEKAHFESAQRRFIPAEILAVEPSAIALTGRRPFA